MAAWVAAARQAASLSRLSSPTSAAQASRLLQRRGLAGGAGKTIQYNTIQYHSYIFNPIHICLYLCSSLHSIDSSFHFPFWVSFGFQFHSFCSNFSSLCWVLPPLSYLTSKNEGIGILGLGSAVPKLESCSYII